MKKRGIVVLLMLLGAAMPAWARGYGHHHGHGHARIGVYFGVPLGLGYPWYGAPSYYYQPPVVVQQAPPVYIERSAPQPAPAAEAYWHYCSSPPGYYPYVKECPGGWMRVVPTPPPN